MKSRQRRNWHHQLTVEILGQLMLLKGFNKSTRRNNLFSRTFVCLSASLLLLRSNAFFSRGFTSSELSVIFHNRNNLLRMSTSTTPTKSTSIEASTSEKKKLLHDKEGSIYPRDPTGTKQVPSVNVTKIIRYLRYVLTNHIDHLRKSIAIIVSVITFIPI